MNNRDFFLATDLDGTFLGGTDARRRELYNWINQNRDRVGLIFVSGRDLPFISQLCQGKTKHGNVPWPDFVIGDVGTTIAKVHHDFEVDIPPIKPVAELELEIAEKWGGWSARIGEMLSDAPGLRLQDTPFRYRVSYHYNPNDYDPQAAEKVRSLGLDVLISDNRFFDILPPGVSKGPSLLRLLEHLEIEPTQVLVAGDTLNDFSLFETGLRGVAVGNSETPLIQKLDENQEKTQNTYRADDHGAGGIMEAIDHHGFNVSVRS